MTTFLLVRHAMCDSVGRSLSGQVPGVSLNAEGEAQAAMLAERLARIRLGAIYTSPLERARQTADAVASRAGLFAELEDGIREIDFGQWTGRSLDELAALPEWGHFNRFRSTARIPGGESMLGAQARTIEALDRIRRRHEGLVVAVVSHADIIRAAIAHYAGVHLDLLHRFQVSPASVSVVRVGEDWATVLALNSTPELPLA